MTFEIEAGGRTRTVSVERSRGSPRAFRVTVDGVEHLVDAMQPAPGSWSLLLGGSGRSLDLCVARGQGPGELLVTTRGVTVPVVVNGRRSRRAAETSSAAGAQRVTAPMPGRVLRVLVAVGDSVAARQPLVVVEAMKMENELTSPKAGVVREVSVSPGASVEAGRPLVVVE